LKTKSGSQKKIIFGTNLGSGISGVDEEQRLKTNMNLMVKEKDKFEIIVERNEEVNEKISQKNIESNSEKANERKQTNDMLRRYKYSSSKKQGPTLPLQVFEQMLDLLEKATALETIITLTQAERLILSKIPPILQIFGYSNSTGPSQNSGTDGTHKSDDIKGTKQRRNKKEHRVNVRTVISEVYNYWVNKRSKLKKPLLRKYWPVTASNDTNPHMVFRPREKEKYKLRKKRQNDLDAYKKMKQLRVDFMKVRVLVDLIQRREKLNKCILDMQCDWFEQRVYSMIDTSGLPRESDRITHQTIEGSLNVHKYFDTQNIERGKKRKRKRASASAGAGTKGGSRLASPIPMNGTANLPVNSNSNQIQLAALNPLNNSQVPKRICADQTNPPPLLHPLKTRESYTTTWENAVPFIPSYVNAKPTQTMRFRHRPRIGRGGRVIIDRIPRPSDSSAHPINVFTSGIGMQITSLGNNRMLDLLPRPLDKRRASRRIEEISAGALHDEEDHPVNKPSTRGISLLPLPSITNSSTSTAINDDSNTQHVLIKLSDWTETDEQVWGSEISTFGLV